MKNQTPLFLQGGHLKMIKYKKYGYWYSNWDTYNTQKATKNRRIQWILKNINILINYN